MPRVRLSQIRLAPMANIAKAKTAITKARTLTRRKKVKIKVKAKINRGIASGAAKMDRIAIWTICLLF